MASSILKKPCSKCNKGMGILTCDGCQQSFCTKHITDHRQQLSIEMDNIGQECDILRRDLLREDNDPHGLLNRINSWEKESMIKIQTIAEQARNDLRQCLDKNQNQIKMICNKLSDELQSSRESGDYTENDFQLWIEQLRELRKMIEKPSMVDILDDDNTSTTIPMIKVKEKTDSKIFDTNARVLTPRRSILSVSEMFDKFIGLATFSENNVVATHTGDPERSTMVYITTLYSSGIHQIRFRIESKSNKYLFFGIINAQEEMSRTIFNSPSLHGWMAPDVRVARSRKVLSGDIHEVFNAGDEISLTLDFDNQEILLENHQTNTNDRLPIDLRVCPLPWKVVVAFFSQNDSVRIIS
jgi:hypothetical protein